MKEPERIPLDPSTPTSKKVKQIPMPALYPESMRDDVYIKETGKSFWQFIEAHKKSRENWLKKTQEDENNQKGNQT